MTQIFDISQTLAENPFFVPDISLNIYSIEELCYYLCNSLFLIDEKIMSVELCTWLEEELGMYKLGEKLREILLKDKMAQGKFVSVILRSVMYCTEQEIVKIESDLNHFSNKTLYEKRKARADQFLESGKISKAISWYKKIMEMKSSQEISKIFIAEIYNNLGVAYARLFLFEKAKRNFEEADSILSTQDLKIKISWCQYYIIAEEEQLLKDKMKFREQIETDLPKWKEYIEYQEIENEKKHLLKDQFEIKIENFIEYWKEKYRNSRE